MENYENNETQEVSQESISEIPKMESTDSAQYMSKKEYLKHHAPESFYKSIRTDSITAYCVLGVSTVLMLFGFGGGILDKILILAFVLGVHLKKSKGCAIALIIYGAFNFIVATIDMGRPAGWLWLALGIIYMKNFLDAEKEYKKIYG